MAVKKQRQNERKARQEVPHYTDKLEKVPLNFGRSPGGPPVRFVKSAKKFSENEGAPQERTNS